MNALVLNRPLIFSSVVGALIFAPLGAEEMAQKPRIVVSGFESFGGRESNASWVLASAMAARHADTKAVQVPVVWGAPQKIIGEQKPSPPVWIAFGEGTSRFRIETAADNRRGQFRDNLSATPPNPEIIAGGDPKLRLDLAAPELARALNTRGFPTEVSEEAGNYLCEEMLYCLLHQRQNTGDKGGLTLFIHVPILGAPIRSDAKGSEPRICDAALLDAFGVALMEEIQRLGWLPALVPQKAPTKPD